MLNQMFRNYSVFDENQSYLFSKKYFFFSNWDFIYLFRIYLHPVCLYKFFKQMNLFIGLDLQDNIHKL